MYFYNRECFLHPQPSPALYDISTGFKSKFQSCPFVQVAFKIPLKFKIFGFQTTSQLSKIVPRKSYRHSIIYNCMDSDNLFTTNASSQSHKASADTSVSSSSSSSFAANKKPPERKPWKPSGLLRKVVAEKEKLMLALEQTLESRPDHPLSLRLNFYNANRPPMYIGRRMRRGDGGIAIIGEMKTKCPRVFEDSLDEEDVGKIPPVIEEPGFLAMQWSDYGVDASLFWTDTDQYGLSYLDMVKCTKWLRRAKKAQDGQAQQTQDTPASRTTTVTTPDDEANVSEAQSSTESPIAFQESPILPIIRGDFIIHPIQIAEAAEAGACAVYLIAAACLPDLEDLLNSTTIMGLEAIVEVHTQIELEWAMECGATILCLTNLDRSTNKVVAGTAEKLRKNVPDYIVTIGHGGITSSSEVWSLLDEGFDATILGRALLRTRRGPLYVQELRSHRRDLARQYFMAHGFDASKEDPSH